MDLEPTQIDLVRSRLILIKSISRRKGRRSSWEAVHEAILDHENVTPESSDLRPFSSETLRRFAIGTQDIGQEGLNLIVKYLIDKLVLSKDEIELNSFYRFDDEIRKLPIDFSTASFDLNDSFYDFLEGTWVVMGDQWNDNWGIESTIIIEKRIFRHGSIMIAQEYGGLISYKSSASLPQLRRRRAFGVALPSPKGSFLVFLRGFLDNKYYNYFPISRFYGSSDCFLCRGGPRPFSIYDFGNLDCKVRRKDLPEHYNDRTLKMAKY